MACVTKRRGRYVIDSYDQTGARRWKTLPEGTTKAQAKEELRRIEDQILRGCYLPDRRIPTFAQVAQDWLDYKRPRLRENSWETCKSHLKNHSDEFENLKINQITTARIEKYISAKQLSGLKVSSIRRILVTLRQIFGYAVRHKYIAHNPMIDAEKPRDPSESKKDIRVLKPAEIPSLLKSTRHQKYRTLFMMAIMTGARQGELLGLKWSDLDIANRQIHIQRTYNNRRFFPPKTKTSDRRIDLSPILLSELKKWKLACPPSSFDLIFPNEQGNPILRYDMVKWHFLPALKAAGLPKIRFHDLRHTYTSLLIEQGENIKYIQTQLGHSSPMMTLNVYAHLFESRNQEAASRLEKAIFGT